MLMLLVLQNRTPLTKRTSPCRMFNKLLQQGRSE